MPKASKKLPTPARKARIRLVPRARWLRRLLLTAFGLLVVLPVLQCSLLLVFNPPLTFTMLSRSLELWKEKDQLRLPAHRSVSLDTLPAVVPQAIVSSEDARFFEHNGFDTDAIVSAWKKNRQRGFKGRIVGGSTISQQVARNAFLWQKRSWLRKGLEAWYTVWLELIVPKERILEIYLNVAETGPMTFGVEAGARRHFRKSAKELDLHEAATIASLLPSPRRWTPDSGRVQQRAAWIEAHLAPIPADIGR